MVVIHFKKSELNQFRWETSGKISIDELIERLCYSRQEVTKVNNLRQKLEKLAGGIEGLADHGPLKPEALRGLTMPETIEPAIEQLPPDQQKFVRQEAGMNQRVNVDKTGYRMGIAPVQEIADKMKQLALEVRNYISGKRVKDRLNTEIPKLEEFVSLLKGMVMIAYPGYHGLPEWDFVFQLLEDKLDTCVLFPDVDWYVPNETTAWFGGRELYRGKSFAEQVAGGGNEKSTFIVKLEKKGSGAPVRESPIDEKTQKDMMAFYYKKQEEAKKMEGEMDDNFSNSAWANPNALKGHLVTGGKDIGFKFR